MKKVLFTICIALLGMSTQAQELKHEVGAFYGAGSASNLFSFYTTALGATVGEQGSWMGPIGVEYYYHISPAVAFGAVVEYATCKALNTTTQKQDFRETFITVMPSVKFNWLRKTHFGLYSALSAGVMILSVSCGDDVKAADPSAKDETTPSFIFQATALGAEFGGAAFRGFIEAGVGEKGLLCAGLRYKF